MTKLKNLSWLAFSLLLAGQGAFAPQSARAGGFDLKNTVDTTKEGAVDLGASGRQKFTLTFDTRIGYDDNSLAQPDSVRIINAAGRPVDVSGQNQGSGFINFDLGLGYTLANSRLAFTLGADVGVTDYWDRPGRSYDVNGGLSLRLTYKLTPRAFVAVSSYNAYQSQGDYGATNLTNFNGQVGTGSTPGTTAARNGDYFYTTDSAALTYQFTPRVSAVFSYNLVAFAYASEPYATDQDRIEHYGTIELHYLLQPNLTLAGTYRLGYIDYFSVNNDSLTNFVLGGVDYTFSPRLKGSFRAGAEFRTYMDTVGDETSPYFEGTLTYDISRTSHLSLTSRYGIYEGALTTDNSKADTFSLGLSFEQNFTARISGYVSFFYNHAQYSTPAPRATPVLFNSGNFTENTMDVAIGARYAINRHFSAEVGYTHTTVLSDLAVREYDRNRYFAGFRFQF